MKIDKKSLLLENNSMYLRPLIVGDITDDYVNGLNDPEVNRYLVDVRRNVQTRDSVGKYVRSNLENPSAVLLGIFIKNDSKRMVGTVHVSGVDFFHFTASVGICLFAKQFWKKGYAQQAIQLVKGYLFGVLGLHYIEAGIYAKNTNSVNMFSRAGFSEWFRVKDKFRLVDSFEEAIYFVDINPLFNRSLLGSP
ncbi:MAG: GNAT family N-acetyltransferase [Thermodesulfobacteriota bacterium]